MKEKWIVFSYNGKELCSYTVRGTFPGEQEETVKLLAAERGIDESEIVVSIIEK